MPAKHSSTDQLRAEGLAPPEGLADRLYGALLAQRTPAEAERGPAEWLEMFDHSPAWRQFRRDWRLAPPKGVLPAGVRERRRVDESAARREDAVQVLMTVVLRRIMLIVKNRRHRHFLRVKISGEVEEITVRGGVWVARVSESDPRPKGIWARVHFQAEVLAFKEIEKASGTLVETGGAKPGEIEISVTAEGDSLLPGRSATLCFEAIRGDRAQLQFDGGDRFEANHTAAPFVTPLPTAFRNEIDVSFCSSHDDPSLDTVDAEMNAWCRDLEGEGASPVDEMLDGYVLLLVSRALITGTRQLGDFWLYRELAESCGEVRYPTDRHELRPIISALVDGRDVERIPGKQGGVRDIVRKTEEDQIKDVLPTELTPFHHSEEGRALVLDQVINGAPLIVQRFREDQPELRHRVLLTLLVNADPENAARGRRSGPGLSEGKALAAHPVQPQKDHTGGAAVVARRLAYRVLTQLALARGSTNLPVDVALFDLREDAWLGVGFPLEQVQASRDPQKRWCNVLAFDRLVPDFFLRWPCEGRFSGGAMRLGREPRQFLREESLRRSYNFYPVVTIRERDERWGGLDDAMASLVNPPRLPATRIDVAIDAESLALAGTAMRSAPGQGWSAKALGGLDDDALTRLVCEMVIGPYRRVES